MNPFSPTQSILPTDSTPQIIKRSREYESELQGKEKKFKASSLALDALPFDAISHICEHLKLPSLSRLGSTSIKMRLHVEQLPIWKKLVRESSLVIPGVMPLSELNATIAQGHIGTLRMCASAHVNEEFAEKNVDRALEFLHRIRQSQSNPADQAETDLDIAAMHLKHSLKKNRLETAYQLNFRVMENDSLPEFIRIKACFAILRISTYYDLIEFEGIDEIIDSAFDHFDSFRLNTEYSYFSEETDLLNCIIRRDMEQDPEQDHQLAQRFLKISESPTAATHLRYEAKLQLIFMHALERNPEMSPKNAFDAAIEIANHSASTSEVANLAKYFAAWIGGKNPDFNFSKDKIYHLYVDVAKSDFTTSKIASHCFLEAVGIAQNGDVKGIGDQELWEFLKSTRSLRPANRVRELHSLYMMIYMATDGRISISQDEIYKMYNDFLKIENVPELMKINIHFCFAKYVFIHPIEKFTHQNLYELLNRLSTSPHLTQPQRWLCKFYIARMNINRQVEWLTFPDIINLLWELEKEPGLPEDMKNYVLDNIRDISEPATVDDI